jgi:prepilin-type processing-associated H-X9-DG protein
MWRFCINRHSGGINMCFLDSSVRKIPLYILWDLKWNREWVPQHYQIESVPWLR